MMWIAAFAGFILTGYAHGNGGKGLMSKVIETSDQQCPSLPPIINPKNQLYVAPDGDDRAAGTFEKPLATLSEAARRFSKGGLIIVRGGVYPSQPMFKATGLRENPLYIRAADGEKPVFDGSDIRMQDEFSGVINMLSATHVVIEGLEVRHCYASQCQGILSDGPVFDLTIRRNHIHHMDGAAARFSGREIRIEDNHFHDVALANIYNIHYPAGGWPSCTGTMPNHLNLTNPWTDDVVIRANRIYNCWGEGINVWYATNVIVEDNSIENVWNAGIYADNAYNIRIARNYIRTFESTHGDVGKGILMGMEDYSAWGLPKMHIHEVLIENNVVLAGIGISWWAATTLNSTYESLHIRHNSIAGIRGGAIGFSKISPGAAKPYGNTIQNNVFYSVIESKLGGADAFKIVGNTWLNSPLPAIAGVGDKTVNIEFTNELMQQAQVNEAQPLVPYVGYGDVDTGLDEDFLCRKRDAFAPTRGAFERI